jgi:hypothetical protein
VSYSKDVGEVSARCRPGGEVPSVTYPSGTHVVSRPGLGDQRSVRPVRVEHDRDARGADPHFHKTFSESFYVMGAP